MTCEICGRLLVDLSVLPKAAIEECLNQTGRHCYRLGYEREKKRADEATAKERARCLAIVRCDANVALAVIGAIQAGVEP